MYSSSRWLSPSPSSPVCSPRCARRSSGRPRTPQVSNAQIVPANARPRTAPKATLRAQLRRRPPAVPALPRLVGARGAPADGHLPATRADRPRHPPPRRRARLVEARRRSEAASMTSAVARLYALALALARLLRRLGDRCRPPVGAPLSRRRDPRLAALAARRLTSRPSRSASSGSSTRAGRSTAGRSRARNKAAATQPVAGDRCSLGPRRHAASARRHEDVVIAAPLLPGDGHRRSSSSSTPTSHEAAFDAAEAEFERLEQVMSRFRPDSELSQLNVPARSTPRPIWPRSSGWRSRLASETGGRFDPTVHDALVAAGYDRTFDEVAPSRTGPARGRAPAAAA